jgi:hypothetical protein
MCKWTVLSKYFQLASEGKCNCNYCYEPGVAINIATFQAANYIHAIPQNKVPSRMVGRGWLLRYSLQDNPGTTDHAKGWFANKPIDSVTVVTSSWTRLVQFRRNQYYLGCMEKRNVFTSLVQALNHIVGRDRLCDIVPVGTVQDKPNNTLESVLLDPLGDISGDVQSLSSGDWKPTSTSSPTSTSISISTLPSTPSQQFIDDTGGDVSTDRGSDSDSGSGGGDSGGDSGGGNRPSSSSLSSSSSSSSDDGTDDTDGDNYLTADQSAALALIEKLKSKKPSGRNSERERALTDFVASLASEDKSVRYEKFSLTVNLLVDMHTFEACKYSCPSTTSPLPLSCGHHWSIRWSCVEFDTVILVYGKGRYSIRYNANDGKYYTENGSPPSESLMGAIFSLIGVGVFEFAPPSRDCHTSGVIGKEKHTRGIHPRHQEGTTTDRERESNLKKWQSSTLTPNEPLPGSTSKETDLNIQNDDDDDDGDRSCDDSPPDCSSSSSDDSEEMERRNQFLQREYRQEQRRVCALLDFANSPNQKTFARTMRLRVSMHTFETCGYACEPPATSTITSSSTSTSTTPTTTSLHPMEHWSIRRLAPKSNVIMLVYGNQHYNIIYSGAVYYGNNSSWSAKSLMSAVYSLIGNGVFKFVPPN